MSHFHAFLLGLVQGIAEFLPISSSAHIQLISFLSNFQLESNKNLFFMVLCNLGTVIATTVFFKKELYAIFRSWQQTLQQLFLPLLPLVPVALLRSHLSAYFSLSFFWIYFLITASVLLLSEKQAGACSKVAFLQKPWQQALWVGMWQACAVIPGISRSAMTLCAGRLLGWNLETSARFSFLLSIPTGLGAFAFESFILLYKKKINTSLLIQPSDITGFATSFFIGWLTLSFVFRIIQSKKISLMPFAVYCYVLAGILWLYL